MPGIVIHSHLKKGKSGSSVGYRTGPQSTVYRPQGIYSYEVQGRRFEGKRLRFGSQPHTCRKSLVRENVARYPEGASVTVHYDPAKPSESVLEPGVAGFWNRRVVFSVALLATGAVLWSMSVALN
jgi:Protein of unknown function (DUF3592)